MQRKYGPWSRWFAQWLHEPTIHFFVVGAVVFFVHRIIVGDPRTIAVSPMLRVDLTRRFRDQNGRAPNTTELSDALQTWERDEALYREALRDRLDRDDAMVRSFLVEKVKTRAALEFLTPEPSQQELDAWLAQHHELYETPQLFDYQYVVFPTGEASAEQQRAKWLTALQKGANPERLGRGITGVKLPRELIQQKFGHELAERICGLPIGEWQPLESQEGHLLIRLNQIDGGLPDAGALRPRLMADWQNSRRQQAVDRAVQAIVARYRFEERPL